MPEYVPPIENEPDVWIHWPAQHADSVVVYRFDCGDVMCDHGATCPARRMVVDLLRREAVAASRENGR